MDSQPPTSAYSGGNAILDRLPPGEREALLPHLSVHLDEEAHVLLPRNQPLERVYFPIDAVFSVVVELSQGHTYEVDVIGREGVVGAEVALGAETAARTVLCQSPGRVAALARTRFTDALERSPALLAAVRESLRRQWFDSQQTVACNFAHTPEQRAARWILMTQNQVGRDRFPMRAEFLSIMLGVPEGLVREPLALLEELGCIRYVDGEVSVTSRVTLHDYACECYDRQQVQQIAAGGDDAA